MAYDFVSASSQHIRADYSTLTLPVTLAAWVRSDNVSATQAILSIEEIDSGINRVTLYHDNLARIACVAEASTQVNIATAGTISNGIWAHAAATFPSTASRTAWANGTAGTPGAVSVSTSSSVDKITIGSRTRNATPGLYFDGLIAEAAVWSVELSAEEIAALAKNVSPALIRPQSLVFYAPLIRDLVDERGGLTLTASNAPTVADHPRVYR